MNANGQAFSALHSSRINDGVQVSIGPKIPGGQFDPSVPQSLVNPIDTINMIRISSANSLPDSEFDQSQSVPSQTRNSADLF
jgi:hypothetical protein